MSGASNFADVRSLERRELMSGVTPTSVGMEATATTNQTLRAEGNLRLSLPQVMYAVVGERMSVRFDNLLGVLGTENYQFEVQSEIGVATAAEWSVIPLASDMGDHGCRIQVSEAGQVIDACGFLLRVVPNDAGNGRQVNLLMVGDSLTHASLYPNELAQRFSTEGGPAVTMLGTHHPSFANAGVNHEGYGGWTWDRFLYHYNPNPDPQQISTRSSPFVFVENGAPRFNLPRYFQETSGGQRPDFVTFLLGINDGISIDPSNPADMELRLNSILTRAETLIQNFRQAAPGVEIGVCLVPPPNARESAFEDNYQGVYTRAAWKPVQHQLVNRMLSAFEGRESERIFVVPTGLNMIPSDSYPANNAVHPNEQGYDEIADSIHAWMRARMVAQIPLIQPAVFEIPENTATGSLVGRVQIENPNPARQRVFSLIGDPQGNAFSIDAATGSLRVADPHHLNYESVASFSVPIKVTDARDPAVFATTTATIQLIDVNEAPTSVTVQNILAELPEDRPLTDRLRVANIFVTDDALGTNTLRLSGNDAATFEIDSSVLYLKAGTALDFATKPLYRVTVHVNDVDLGSTPADASKDFVLNFADVNTFPVVSGTVAQQSLPDNTVIAPFSTLTVVDPDRQEAHARVTITNGVHRGDFTAESTTGWLRSVQGTDLIYERRFTSGPNIGSVVQSAMRVLVFQPHRNVIKPNSTETTAFAIEVQDRFASAIDTTTTVITTSVNDAPQFGNANGLVAVNDDSVVKPFHTLTVTDADLQEMRISVTILNGAYRGDFTTATTAGWSRSTVGNDVSYSRYFAPGPQIGAEVQAAFRTLDFQPRINAINPGNTEATDFLITASDGVAPAISNRETRVITTSVNNAPGLAGVSSTLAMNDSSNVHLFPSLTVADPDHQAMMATVTIVNGLVRGDLTETSRAGWVRSVSHQNLVYSRYFNPRANAGSDVQAAIRALVFQPRTNGIKPNTTEATDITVVVNDGRSSTSATTRVVTNSVNDVPVLGGLNAHQAVNDDATVTPFSTLTVSDADLQEMLITVTIRNGRHRGDFINANADSGWTVRYTTGNDITYKRYLSPQVNVGAAAQAAFRALIFQPRSDAIKPGTTEATDFHVTVSDGVAPAVLGTGPRVTATSVNTPPAIETELAVQIANVDTNTVLFNTLTVTDSDMQNLFVRVTIANGVSRGDFLAASATGWTRIVSGGNIVYERYFAPAFNNGAKAQAAIRTLVFQPRSNLPPGTAETTYFSVFVNDGMANVTNNTTSVITTNLVLDRPSVPVRVQPRFAEDDDRAEGKHGS